MENRKMEKTFDLIANRNPGADMMPAGKHFGKKKAESANTFRFQLFMINR